MVDCRSVSTPSTILNRAFANAAQEAADLLRVSRTTSVRLLENGAIAFDKPNKHRRVLLDDLMEYRRRQPQVADQALSDMVADSQRLGLHEQNPEQACGALEHARS